MGASEPTYKHQLHLFYLILRVFSLSIRTFILVFIEIEFDSRFDTSLSLVISFIAWTEEAPTSVSIASTARLTLPSNISPLIVNRVYFSHYVLRRNCNRRLRSFQLHITYGIKCSHTWYFILINCTVTSTDSYWIYNTIVFNIHNQLRYVDCLDYLLIHHLTLQVLHA